MNDIIFSQGEDHVNAIRDSFSKDGPSQIHVLADFDRTLTKNFVEGEEKPSLVSVLRKQGILGERYSKAAYELYDTYHPLEVSTSLSLSEKKLYMDGWWEKHMQLLVDTGIYKHHIETALNLGKIEFREGIKDLLNFLEQYNIPLIIISANALGADSISRFFQLQGLNTDNIHIVSNKFEWNIDGKAIGYKKPVVHTFNKDETILSDFPSISKQISERTNVILLGDSQGDPGMIDGFPVQNLLKIGFLNKDKSKFEQTYKSLYDVIICEDGNLDFLNNFLENI